MLNALPMGAVSVLIFGQMPLFAEVAAEHPLLYSYGPMGIILGWFMWRGEKMANNIVAELKDQSKEIRTMNHRMDGVQKAMLVEVVSRDNCHPFAHKAAQEMIAKISAREEKE